MFGLVGISIPTNIFLVTRIFYKPFTCTEKAMFALAIVYQGVTLGALLFPIAALHTQMHKPKQFLLLIQRALHREHLITKFKVDSLLYRLTRGPKYGMTVGPLPTVTH